MLTKVRFPALCISLALAAAGCGGGGGTPGAPHGPGGGGPTGSAGTITEFALTTKNANPYGLTAGPDGNVWFNELINNKIGKITPSGGVTEYTIPGPFLQL
ncbi:MAG TPA: hypothetical protein VGY57_16965, partial [Vicinamibacterales bacterium]|nr:hypothetical protein [Vicinamibacterales bacterium]